MSKVKTKLAPRSNKVMPVVTNRKALGKKVTRSSSKKPTKGC